jgi:hypothetical protein
LGYAAGAFQINFFTIDTAFTQTPSALSLKVFYQRASGLGNSFSITVFDSFIETKNQNLKQTQ